MSSSHPVFVGYPACRIGRDLVSSGLPYRWYECPLGNFPKLVRAERYAPATTPRSRLNLSEVGAGDIGCPNGSPPWVGGVDAEGRPYVNSEPHWGPPIVHMRRGTVTASRPPPVKKTKARWTSGAPRELPPARLVAPRS
jgi:hypothetical protein